MTFTALNTIARDAYVFSAIETIENQCNLVVTSVYVVEKTNQKYCYHGENYCPAQISSRVCNGETCLACSCVRLHWATRMWGDFCDIPSHMPRTHSVGTNTTISGPQCSETFSLLNNHKKVHEMIHIEQILMYFFCIQKE